MTFPTNTLARSDFATGTFLPNTTHKKHLHKALAARESLSCIININIIGRVYQGLLSLIQKISYTAKQQEGDFFYI